MSSAAVEIGALRVKVSLHAVVLTWYTIALVQLLKRLQVSILVNIGCK